MIRAKMSDTRHASEKMVHMLGQALPAMAVQEARAILAETEASSPAAWTGSVSTLKEASSAFPMFYAAEISALAESLSAFVQS